MVCTVCMVCTVYMVLITKETIETIETIFTTFIAVLGPLSLYLELLFCIFAAQQTPVVAPFHQAGATRHHVTP